MEVEWVESVRSRFAEQAVAGETVLVVGRLEVDLRSWRYRVFLSGERTHLMASRERLKSMGYELRMLDISLKHLRDTWDREHALAANKSLTWTYITYHYLPLRKVLWRKHPIELARRWLWALEWVLMRRHMRRSILYR
jgi:hypothetical protein